MVSPVLVAWLAATSAAEPAPAVSGPASGAAAVDPGDLPPPPRVTRPPPPRATAPTAGSPSTAASDSPSRSAPALIGRVVLADLDEPLAGVSIVVRSATGTWRATSGPDGDFRIDALPPGTYRLGLADPAIGAAHAEATLAGDDVVVTLAVRTEVIALEERYRTAAERSRESAEAVNVVETTQARRQSADLGEVLARTSGVSVSRAGGLGSDARFSLNGLSGDQVRFFLDGAPLDLAGFPFGVVNVPVNLVDRVEIYTGVVPVRFGADALGGVVNLVSAEPRSGTHATASYQVGSFATHRATVSASSAAASGAFTSADVYYDRAANDYDVEVKAAGEGGREIEVTVPRFHDRYQALGAVVAAGMGATSWADRLFVRAFVSDYDKDLQHNQTMSKAFGGAGTGGISTGGSLHYRSRPSPTTSLSAVVGYSRERTDLSDRSTCIYDWYGACVPGQDDGGEIDGTPRDRSLWSNAAFVVATAEARLGSHALRLSISPTATWRHGNERLERAATPDPVESPRRLLAVVAGTEHELDGFGDRVENIAFAKIYVQAADAERILPSGAVDDLDRTSTRGGIGDSLRYRMVDWLWAKASYELATRLPRVDEVFGDGVLIEDNLDLRPEVSHNANLGLALDVRDSASGTWNAELGGFVRDIDQLIRLSGTAIFSRYQNVASARSLGVDGRLAWLSPGRHVAVDASATYLDFRNTSTDGPFASYRGDRIPNRPYLHATLSGRLLGHDLLRPRDELSLGWTARYSHQTYLSWESVGAHATKPTTPSQLVHTASIGYQLPVERGTVGASIDVHNATDERVLDFYGVQRPGRSVFFKLVVER